MIVRSILCTILCIPLSFFAENVLAEDTESGHGGHHYRAHEVAVFTGITTDRRDGGFSLGLEYERRFSANFGVGAVLEHTWGDFNYTIATIPLIAHSGAWKFSIAPGIETVDGHTKALGRLSTAYHFSLNGQSLAPSFSVDFIDGETALIFGVAFPIHF